MAKCPVCNSKTQEKHQQYCNTCAWELEWFLGDLSIESKKEYSNKLKIHKVMYLKSIQKNPPPPEEGDNPPANSYFGLGYFFRGIYLFVKYFIKFVSWLILLGLLVGIFAIVFEKLAISFDMFTNKETGMLVGLGTFVFITGIYMYKKFSK